MFEHYNTLLNENEVSFELEEVHRNNIDATVKTVEAFYFGQERFPRKTLKAAAYFCFLIKDHPVTDGNKRLAVMFLDFYCETNGIKIEPAEWLDVLAVSIERSPESHDQLDELVGKIEKILFTSSLKK